MAKLARGPMRSGKALRRGCHWLLNCPILPGALRVVSWWSARLVKAAVVGLSSSEGAPTMASTSLVTEWLKSNGLEMYATSFLAKGFDDMKVVASMTASDLAACGVTLPGHLKKLELAISSLNEVVRPPPVQDIVKVADSAPAPPYNSTEAYNSHVWTSPCLNELCCFCCGTALFPLVVCGCFDMSGSSHVICPQCKVPHKGSGIKECLQCGKCAECVLERRGGPCPGFIRGGKCACVGNWSFL